MNEIYEAIAVTLIVASLEVAFPILLGLAKQLEPDAHLKPCSTVLIEGEILNVLIEPELERVET